MPDRKSSLNLTALLGVQGLIDAINKLEGAINNTASYLFIDNETPGGSINDTNKVFTLANAPYPILSLKIYLNGVYQSPGGEDYTLDNVTVTFINAPNTSSILRAFYRYK